MLQSPGLTEVKNPDPILKALVSVAMNQRPGKTTQTFGRAVATLVKCSW